VKKYSIAWELISTDGGMSQKHVVISDVLWHVTLGFFLQDVTFREHAIFWWKDGIFVCLMIWFGMMHIGQQL
jgi:hypothetical protein